MLCRQENIHHSSSTERLMSVQKNITMMLQSFIIVIQCDTEMIKRHNQTHTSYKPSSSILTLQALFNFLKSYCALNSQIVNQPCDLFEPTVLFSCACLYSYDSRFL